MSISEVSDFELKFMISEHEKIIKENLRYVSPKKYEPDDDKKIKAFYAAHERFVELREELYRREEIESQKRRSERKEEEKKRPFVNGFGEATTREIETSGYRVAQKKLDAQIMRFVGGRI